MGTVPILFFRAFSGGVRVSVFLYLVEITKDSWVFCEMDVANINYKVLDIVHRYLDHTNSMDGQNNINALVKLLQ